jgi:hypothetical protein
MSDDLEDPWAVTLAAPRQPSTAGFEVFVLWAIVSLPYAARVVAHNSRGQVAAILLGVSGAALLGALTSLVRPATRMAGAGLAVLAAAASGPLVGRTPGVLVLASAIIGGVGASSGRGRRVDGGLLIAMVLALNGIWWFRTGSPRIAIVGLTAAVVVAVFVRRRPDMGAAAEAGVNRGALALGRAAATVVIAVFAVPLVYLPAVVTAPLRAVRSRRGRQGGSSWRTRSVGPGDEVRDAGRPFAPVPAAQRRALNGAGVVLVVAAGAWLWSVAAREPIEQVVVAPAEEQKPQRTHRAGIEQPPLSLRPAFADAPWADELDAEHQRYGDGHLVTDRRTGYVLGDFRGRYTTVLDGSRSVRPVECTGCPGVTMWWMGGSAAFGWLQRDAHTIPSYLARLAAADGISLDVINMGTPGWTIWQENRHFERLLEGSAPDVAVFYNGFNDAIGGVVDAALDQRLDPSEPTLLDGPRVDEYRADPPPLRPVGGPDEVGRVLADRYLRVRSDALEAANSGGVQAFFVLQPDAFGSLLQLGFVEQATFAPPGRVATSELARAVAAFERRLGDSVIGLRHLFDDQAVPIFSDPVHTNERGARLAAEAIYEALADSLRMAAR